MLPESRAVDVAATRNEGYRSYLGRSARHARKKSVEILEKGNLHRKVQLNSQKSAPPIVPKKQPTTVKGRGGRLAKADERSHTLVMKSVALRRFND